MKIISNLCIAYLKMELKRCREKQEEYEKSSKDWRTMANLCMQYYHKENVADAKYHEEKYEYYKSRVETILEQLKSIT